MDLRTTFCIFVLALAIKTSNGAVTIEQMQKAGDMMKTACIGKTKISEDHLTDMRAGIFKDDKDVKCYVNCIFEMMQTMKKGKMNYDSAVKQINALVPDGIKEGMLSVLESCRESPKGIKDNCDASFAVIKCFREKDPNMYFPA